MHVARKAERRHRPHHGRHQLASNDDPPSALCLHPRERLYVFLLISGVPGICLCFCNGRCTGSTMRKDDPQCTEGQCETCSGLWYLGGGCSG